MLCMCEDRLHINPLTNIVLSCYYIRIWSLTIYVYINIYMCIYVYIRIYIYIYILGCIPDSCTGLFQYSAAIWWNPFVPL